MSAETIIYNAKIATNAIPSFVGAIAIEGGKVSATGNSDELLRLADPMTTVIDAKGRPYGVL
jgi:predicted amidohydrolase YtcJ